MLSIHANPEEFENATNAGNFRFAFDENFVPFRTAVGNQALKKL